jgi:hypothetical protein
MIGDSPLRRGPDADLPVTTLRYPAFKSAPLFRYHRALDLSVTIDPEPDNDVQPRPAYKYLIFGCCGARPGLCAWSCAVWPLTRRPPLEYLAGLTVRYRTDLTPRLSSRYRAFQ